MASHRGVGRRGTGPCPPLGAEGALCDCLAPSNRECFTGKNENVVGGRDAESESESESESPGVVVASPESESESESPRLP